MLIDIIRKEREKGNERIEKGEDINSFEEVVIETILRELAQELRERAIKSKDGKILKAGFVTSYFLEQTNDTNKKNYIKGLLKNNTDLDKIVNECINYKSQEEVRRQKRKRIIKYSVIGALSLGLLTAGYCFKKNYDVKIEKKQQTSDYVERAWKIPQ